MIVHVPCWRVVRTVPINRKSPKLSVQTTSIGRQSPKWTARTIYYHIRFPTMCRALFIQNEKVYAIRRIPPISSDQFSFPTYAQLNTHYHILPNYYTFYDISMGLNIATWCIYSPCVLLRIYMPPPRHEKQPSILLPSLSGDLAVSQG